MKPADLVLRCYAESSQGYWSSYCLDLTLYATGETFEESRKKLDQEICEYVNEALIGKDREFAAQLMRRRAPVSEWLRYLRGVLNLIGLLVTPLNSVSTKGISVFWLTKCARRSPPVMI